MTLLELPFPPSANRYWRMWRGHVVKSNEAREYREMCMWRLRGPGGRAVLPPPHVGPVSVSVTVYRPARRGDLDNRLKVLLDVLQGVAYVNDSQVVEIHALQLDDPSNPRVVVAVEAWAGAGSSNGAHVEASDVGTRKRNGGPKAAV